MTQRLCRLLDEIARASEKLPQLMQQDKTLASMIENLMNTAKQQYDTNKSFGVLHIYACAVRASGKLADHQTAINLYEEALSIWDENTPEQEEGIVWLELARTYARNPLEYQNVLRAYNVAEEKRVTLENVDQVHKEAAQSALEQSIHLKETQDPSPPSSPSFLSMKRDENNSGSDDDFGAQFRQLPPVSPLSISSQIGMLEDGSSDEGYSSSSSSSPQLEEKALDADNAPAARHMSPVAAAGRLFAPVQRSSPPPDGSSGNNSTRCRTPIYLNW